ncbi:AI-2E family transporter [Nostoc sp. UHCC 0870]|uniref:AI-2E family transporter n=1 Tax=Nostoc sp. UHCC 0870 TaxID=2914041 RepID=UPI001EE14C69|nr:AI-2E family transporter [Nostoc sp. UHCC 0870]UKO98292.1 AI-2E family transporter [Nostoc sp. UHCC 0870]
MRFGQWIGLFIVAISFYILWQIRQILLIVFASIVLATILNRFLILLQRFRIKRSIAILITLSILLLIIFSFFFIIVPQLIEQLQQLGTIIPIALDRLRLWNDWFLKVLPDDVLDNIRNFRYLTQDFQTWLNRLLNNFLFLVTRSLNIALGLLLFLALTIMLMADPQKYRRGFILLFPAFYRQRMNVILNKCAVSLNGWIRGTLLTMLLISILSYIGLSILGVPLPLVNAILAGFLEFIPNVGPTLSVIPPALLAVVDAPWKAVAVVVLYFIIQQVESLIILPWVMKTQVSLLPAVTLLSVVIFGAFFGFLGVFLAVPLVIVLQILIQEILVKDILNNWNIDRD